MMVISLQYVKQFVLNKRQATGKVIYITQDSAFLISEVVVVRFKDLFSSVIFYFVNKFEVFCKLNNLCPFDITDLCFVRKCCLPTTTHSVLSLSTSCKEASIYLAHRKLSHGCIFVCLTPWKRKSPAGSSTNANI